MITITNAENALKTVYLGAITELLNTKINPLLAKIEQTSVDVSGKEIRRAVRTSLDGGVGAGDEAGELPFANSANFLQYIITLKNLYGQIEISDKAMRAGNEDKGAFTNLLNDSLEGLLEASRFNLSRMLFGNGTGFLCTVSQGPHVVGTLNTIGGDANNITEGMSVDVFSSGSTAPVRSNVRVLSVDRSITPQRIVLDMTGNLMGNHQLFVQGSRNKEITGLAAIFDTGQPLYGIDRTKHRILTPYIDNSNQKVGDILFSTAIDHIESFTSSNIDYITCAQNVKLAYQQYLSTFKRNVDIMELAGGYKTISFNGIPIVGERFVPNNIVYMLDTKAFKMHQLCDWQFIESENGKVLRQMQGRPIYSATLVKYCDIVCDKPNGQAMLRVDASL